MLQLRVFGAPPTMGAVADSLRRIPGSRHVIQIGNGELLRWRLAGRAVVALVLGLAAACVVGGVMTGALNGLDLLPKGGHINSSFLAGLSTVNISTPIVAFAAGVVSVAVHICPDQMSKDDYKRMIGELEKEGVNEPEGRLYHAAYGEDQVQMFEVWRSQEDVAARSDKLFATLQGAGVNVDRVDVHPLHSGHPD